MAVINAFMSPADQWRFRLVETATHISMKLLYAQPRRVTVCESTILVFNQPTRPTQPGHPSMGRCDEY